MELTGLLQEHTDLGALIAAIKDSWASILPLLDTVVTSDEDQRMVCRLIRNHLDRLDESAAALMSLLEKMSQNPLTHEDVLSYALWT